MRIDHKDRETVMKMAYEKIKTAFIPEYRVLFDEENLMVEVTDIDRTNCWFSITYDDMGEYFLYEGCNMDSSIITFLVDMQNKIDDEYPYQDETVIYQICGENEVGKISIWDEKPTLEEARNVVNKLSFVYPDRTFYVGKETRIRERVIL